MPTKFKSFEELGQVAKQENDQAEIEAKDRIKTIIQERMGDLLPGYKIKSELEGVDTITIIKNRQNDGFFINFYPDPQKLNHFEISIFKDGTLSGRIPKEFGFNQQDIAREVLDVLDTVGLDFWYNEPQDILSIPDWPVPEKKEEGPGPKIVSEDRRRIEFFKKQPDVLFGFPGKDGFAGYYGFVFNGFIVLEHPLCENAAYFIDLEQKLTEEEVNGAKTRSGREKLMEKYWEPYKGRGKWDVFQSGAERISHRPIDKWIPQMAETLNSRNPLPNRGVEFEATRKDNL